jgi:hypothetical protein
MPQFELHPDILFNGDLESGKKLLTEFIGGYASSLGLTEIEVEGTAIENVLNGMMNMPWPHGVKNASAFKKVASLATNFVFYSPIITTFPPEKFGELSAYQNSIVAYELSKAALHGASIECPFRGKIILKNPIVTSRHFWKELVATLEHTNPQHHFACVSLLFESLAYRANSDACYTNTIGRMNPEFVK